MGFFQQSKKLKWVNKHVFFQKRLSELREHHVLPRLGEVVRLHAWRVKVNRPTLHAMMGVAEWLAGVP